LISLVREEIALRNCVGEPGRLVTFDVIL